MVLAKLWV